MAEDHVATPRQGSGPGVLLLYPDDALAGGMTRICDRFGEEGYVALARAIEKDGSDEAATALDALRRHDRHRGGTAVVAFGSAALAALALAARDGADGETAAIRAVVLYDPPEAPVGEALAATTVPVTLHRASAQADSAPAGPEDLRVFLYDDCEPGFAVPETASFDGPAAALAWSHTISALKRAMGPHYNLEELWAWHLACEFRLQDADAAIATMVDEPYVNHVPTLTGGFGREMLRRFYADHFVNQVPSDRRSIPISQTVGPDRIVDEKIFCFTHDAPIDWMLPGVAPTGRYVEIPLVGIVTFRGDRLVNEHIYWDQASVLVQIGLLDPAGLPVAGREQAAKILDPSLPSNALMPNWKR